MKDGNTKSHFLNSTEKEKQKTNSNNFSNNESNSNSNLPIINERRILIHQPSDFLKNKYTFFGSVSHNLKLLDKENKKTFNSPKFNLKDVKKQIAKGNEIIESIIKEDISLLPNLLKNYSNDYSSNENSVEKTNENYFNSQNTNVTKSKITENTYRKDFNNIRTFNKTNETYKFNNMKMIKQKAEKLVNLNFLISSPKKIRANFINHKNNYYQFLGNQNMNMNMNFNSNQNFHFQNVFKRNLSNNGRNLQYFSIDALNRMNQNAINIGYRY